MNGILKTSTLKNNYKQYKLFIVQLVWEIFNFVCVTISAVVTSSILMWFDFFDSLSGVIQTTLVTAISKRMTKNLLYYYNYGTSKIEALVSIVCDVVETMGLFIVIALSIHELFSPNKPSVLLFYAVLLKGMNIIYDLVIVLAQKRIRKKRKGKISESNLAANMSSFIFDVVSLLCIVAVLIFRDDRWSWYVSPVFCIIIAIFFLFNCFKRFAKAISELTEKTLSEDIQMKITKTLVENYDYYSEYHFVKSKIDGNDVVIDLHLSFERETPYSSIIEFKEKMRSSMSEYIESPIVNIVVE